MKIRIISGKRGEYSTRPKMQIFFDNGVIGQTEYSIGGISPYPIPTGAKQISRIEMTVDSGNDTHTTLHWP
jgi:hypothetical protein